MKKAYLLIGILILPPTALASDHSGLWGNLTSKFTEFFPTLSGLISVRVSCSSQGKSAIKNLAMTINDKLSTITVEKIDDDRLNFVLPMQGDGSVWIETSFTHEHFVDAAGKKYPNLVNRYKAAMNKDISKFHRMEQERILETVNNRYNSIKVDRETGKAVWEVGPLTWPKYAAFPVGFSDQKAYKMIFNCKPVETKF